MQMNVDLFTIAKFQWLDAKMDLVDLIMYYVHKDEAYVLA